MDKKDAKPICKYGSKCYRRNAEHLKEFRHIAETTSSSVEKEETPSQAEAMEIPKNTKKRGHVDDYFKPTQSSVKAATSGESSTSGVLEKSKKTAEKPQTSGESSKKARMETSAETLQCSDDEPMGEVPSNDDNLLDPKETIKQKFLVEMPEDFYQFWDFVKGLNSKKPEEALVVPLGLHLVGPYHVLARKLSGKCISKQTDYLLHWRYYYDPPEFLTVLQGDNKTQFHMGYFRDDPKELPAFVASNSAKENGVIKPRGENIFAAVSWFIDEALKSQNADKSSLSKLQSKLKTCAESHSLSLDQRTTRMKQRDKRVVCRSFHGAGVCVPVDTNGVGYRELPENPADLKKILKKIVESKTDEERDKNFDPLMEIITFIQFANDECDYGEGLELGLDLFCFGGEVFHKTILGLLPLAYRLLGRHEFAQIIEAHLADRRNSTDIARV